MAAGRLEQIEAGPATAHLIWLAAADGRGGTRAKLAAMGRSRGRAGSAAGGGGDGALWRIGGDLVTALRDVLPPVRVAPLTGLAIRPRAAVRRGGGGGAGRRGTFVRQAAAFLLARRASAKALTGLCESPDVKSRRAGVLACGFRLTVPSGTKTSRRPPAGGRQVGRLSRDLRGGVKETCRSWGGPVTSASRSGGCNTRPATRSG